MSDPSDPAPRAAKPRAIKPAASSPIEPATAITDADQIAASPPARKKHKARVEHKVPGRIRMKVPTAKANPEVLEVYRSAFSSIPGVSKITAKPETGSIVIHYDPKAEADFHRHLDHCCTHHEVAVDHNPPENEVDQFARKIETEAEFLAQHSQMARVTVDFFKGCDRELKTLTDNTIDLKIVLAGGLAAFTFLEIGAEAATPMWVTLALFSLNHFAELQNAPHLTAPTSGASAPGTPAAR